MKYLFALILVALAVWLGYVGIFCWLVGGIVTVLREVRAEQMNESVLVWAGVKAFFFEVPLALAWTAWASILLLSFTIAVVRACQKV